MAKLRAPFAFSGTLQGLSAYTRRDLPGTVILRTPSGPSRHAYHTKPSYALNRRNGHEFGGRSTAAKWVRHALYPLRPLEDHNVASALNSLLQPLQVLDTESPWGSRSVRLSRNPGLLAGFPLNLHHPLEGVVRTPLGYTVSKEALSARLEVPELLPGVNFFPPPHQPYFRVMAVLGVVPDVFSALPCYQPGGDYSQLFSEVAHTAWQPVKGGRPAEVLRLQLPYTPPDTHFSLVLAAAVQMGTAGAAGNIEAVRYTGSARVLAAE